MRTTRLFHHVYNRLASLPAVTVAYITGHALGGGLELGLACDLRIASRKAKLGLPEARMGLLPGAGGAQRLTELCGPGIAARLILTCDLVQGDEARDTAWFNGSSTMTNSQRRRIAFDHGSRGSRRRLCALPNSASDMPRRSQAKARARQSRA